MQEVKARLANIFKKIGDKASTETGLQELWQFQQDHPSTDLTPHLARTSDQFRHYIQRGLSKVERRMQRTAGAKDSQHACVYACVQHGCTQTPTYAWHCRFEKDVHVTYMHVQTIISTLLFCATTHILLPTDVVTADVGRDGSGVALADQQPPRDHAIQTRLSELQTDAVAAQDGTSAVLTSEDLSQDALQSPSRLDSLRERMNRINAAAVSSEQPQQAVEMMPAATERTSTSHMTGTMEALQQRMSLLRKKQEQL